jgi:uncharacterized protein YdaU (DUF1376 family)
MNYYKRHLGDYAKDTKHLTLAEHGAFTVLLDYYYATEKPIPDDRCERIANAYANYERAAVRSVLLEFFALTESGWINRRADRVIGESEAKSLKAKESADARWSKDVCERNANASKTHGERNASHKPLAISHKPLKKEQEKATIVADPLLGVNETIARDFRKLRSTQKAPITETAIAGIRREATKAGLSLDDALAMCCERTWRGFKADCINGNAPAPRQRRDL